MTAAVATTLLFIGCSVDSVQIIEHPKHVNPSAQFEVSLVNQYALILNGASVPQSVNRDSLHLAIGLPSGYSVVAAKYYFANALSVLKLATKMDSATAEQAVKDSTALYKSRALVMQNTPQFVTNLKHRTYMAKNEDEDDSMKVNTDAVVNWSAWGGKVSIAIPSGTLADTSLDTMGMSLGVISKSVFIWLTLTAKNSLGQDTLLYFTKTAAMPALSDTANTDIGEIKYAPLSITNSGIKLTVSPKQDHSTLSGSWNPGSGRLVIQFRAICKDAIALEVFNVSGKKVADLSPALFGSNGFISWNIKNSAAQAGLYILRLKTRNGSISTTVSVP